MSILGMNAAVVLVALLLAVPVQLFISHYMSKSAVEEEGKNIHEIRADAMSTSVNHVVYNTTIRGII